MVSKWRRFWLFLLGLVGWIVRAIWIVLEELINLISDLGYFFGQMLKFIFIECVKLGKRIISPRKEGES